MMKLAQLHRTHNHALIILYAMDTPSDFIELPIFRNPKLIRTDEFNPNPPLNSKLEPRVLNLFPEYKSLNITREEYDSWIVRLDVSAYTMNLQQLLEANRYADNSLVFMGYLPNDERKTYADYVAHPLKVKEYLQKGFFK